MAEIYQGSTPTITSDFPMDIDMTNVVDVYLSFAKGKKEVLTVKDPVIANGKVKCTLTQEQTLALPIGDVLIQLNVTYNCNGTKKREPSPLGVVRVRWNAYGRVM